MTLAVDFFDRLCIGDAIIVAVHNVTKKGVHWLRHHTQEISARLTWLVKYIKYIIYIKVKHRILRYYTVQLLFGQFGMWLVTLERLMHLLAV